MTGAPVPADPVEILRELVERLDAALPCFDPASYSSELYVNLMATWDAARALLAHRDTAETTVEWGRSDDVSTAIRPMPSEAFARSQIKHWGEYHGRPGQKLWRREVGPWRPVSPEPQPENEKESSP